MAASLVSSKSWVVEFRPGNIKTILVTFCLWREYLGSEQTRQAWEARITWIPLTRRQMLWNYHFGESSNKDFQLFDHRSMFTGCPFGPRSPCFPGIPIPPVEPFLPDAPVWPGRPRSPWGADVWQTDRQSSHCLHQLILAFRQWKQIVDGLVSLSTLPLLFSQQWWTGPLFAF